MTAEEGPALQSHEGAWARTYLHGQCERAEAKSQAWGKASSARPACACPCEPSNAALCLLQVLKFEGIQRAFGGFDDRAAAERFEARLKLYLGLWCCVKAHPGHIW